MKKSQLNVGVDVPWVTSWTAETITGVARCASIGGRLALCQDEAAGYGRPEYSKNHLLRQRLSIRRMLCPMCGQPTHQGDRWTQVARRTSAGSLRRGARRVELPNEIQDGRVVVDAGSIAPLHKACSDLSLQHCPHLKADPNVDVQRFPERWLVTPLLIAATADDGGETPVVAFLQLMGVTERIDKDWRRKGAAQARAA
ncbi:MAG: hypothetical protein EON88_13550 [Brevundimonas sp.]|nr:MAG: hypothetical protein EON88_13550 [Brevundimonas sp.]